MTVMIIEDERMLLTALTEEFMGRGWKVQSAADGQQALDMLRTRPHMDVIVLDLVLPKIDGFEVLKAMKNNQKLKNIPVVVLTNLSDGQTIAAIISAGCRDYLVKADYTLKETVDKVIEIAQRPLMGN